jgi:hypothetical protein
MPLSSADKSTIEAFRAGIERRATTELSLQAAQREDRPDGSALISRLRAADHIFFELVVRPAIPQVRVGIVTDDRWRNEDLEDRIEESGDSMSEFVEMGFEEAGLEWIGPPVEHYREHGQYFCFATAVDLPSIATLNDDAVRGKVWRMLHGYHLAFGPAIRKMAEAP